MKVYICKPEKPEEFMTVKAVHFSNNRRERVRTHIIKQSGTSLVWFEDEHPPPEVVSKIEEAMEDGEAS